MFSSSVRALGLSVSKGPEPVPGTLALRQEYPLDMIPHTHLHHRGNVESTGTQTTESLEETHMDTGRRRNSTPAP